MARYGTIEYYKENVDKATFTEQAIRNSFALTEEQNSPEYLIIMCKAYINAYEGLEEAKEAYNVHRGDEDSDKEGS